MPEFSIAERILDAVKTALLAAPHMLDVEDRVERAREDSYTRDELAEGGAINVKASDENTKMFSEALDDNELSAEVIIYTRGDVWETRADRIAVLAHARIMGCAYDGLALARVRKTGRAYEADAADATAGRLTLQYAFRFLTLAGDITLQP